MSEFGVGPEDWIEFDLDQVNHDHRQRVLQMLDEHRAEIERVLGAPFEADIDPDGDVTLRCGDTDVARAERTNTDRLLVTRFPPADGPL
ncbi:MAG: hypothetical protein AAGA99_11915 [Actinomycetota bacterium]